MKKQCTYPDHHSRTVVVIQVDARRLGSKYQKVTRSWQGEGKFPLSIPTPFHSWNPRDTVDEERNARVLRSPRFEAFNRLRWTAQRAVESALETKRCMNIALCDEGEGSGTGCYANRRATARYATSISRYTGFRKRHSVS